MVGKRSRAVTKGLKPKKRITAKQRAARKVNIEVARRAKKSGQKGSSEGAGKERTEFARRYKQSRAIGLTKAKSLQQAVMMTTAGKNPGKYNKLLDSADRRNRKRPKPKFSDIQPFRGDVSEMP